MFHLQISEADSYFKVFKMTVQIQHTTALAEWAAANSQSWAVGWGRQPSEEGAQLAKRLGHAIRHCSCKPGKQNGLRGTVQPLRSLQDYLLPVPDRGPEGAGFPV